MAKDKLGIALDPEKRDRVAPYHERSSNRPKLYRSFSGFARTAIETHLALLQHLEQEGQIEHHDDPEWLSENVFGADSSPESLENGIRRIVRDELNSNE